MRTVITYGTFDIFHAGHLHLLQRARAFGDRLVVGVSTDEFNASKGKSSLFPFEERSAIVGAIKCVDEVFPETSWTQKRSDIERFTASVFVIGDDWKNKFDDLGEIVEVIYLPRTPNVSTTQVKASLKTFSEQQVDALRSAVDAVSSIVRSLA